MTIDFTFRELLAKRGLPIDQGRLVRHDHTGRRLFEMGGGEFAHFASTQFAGGRSPYKSTTLTHHFVPHDGGDTLYVGSWRIGDRWLAVDDPERRWRQFKPNAAWNEPHDQFEAYDMEPIAEMDDLAGRVVIDWGPATRAWSQWLRRRDKPIVEIKRRATEPPFPGFKHFAAVVSTVPLLPPVWRELLGSVGGVYLLAATSGELYIGSAYGAGGFLGRWRQYADDGHGGNLLLRSRPVFDATVSILAVMDKDAEASEVIREEAYWKVKLGSRAHGLNAN